MRSISLSHTILFGPLFVLAAGCAASTPPMSTATPASASVASNDRRPPTPHRLLVKISRPEGGATLASTSAILPENRELSFETKSGPEHAEARLVVDVERHAGEGKGPYVVRVEWDEKTPDGRTVRWAPTLAVNEGTKSTAVVDWGSGDGRLLELELGTAETPGAPVASEGGATSTAPSAMLEARAATAPAAEAVP
ncbi:MAG TPA: hypothetical protein VL400_21650 [Polyangiaceae bacterium]|nr:hypothetical protein [Polyangiaceae bacterium]